MKKKSSNGKNPRILMIAPVFYPYPPVWPEGIVNAKLASAMKNAGWHIDIIVAGYSAGTSRYPSDAAGWDDLADNVHIIPIDQHKPSLLKRLLNASQGFLLTGKILRQLEWGLTAAKISQQLNAKAPYDLIISRAVPDYAHFAGCLAHRQTRIPWVANWNDPTPNHKFPPPYGQGPSSPLAPNVHQWYTAVCKYCSWHTFPSERLGNYMSAYLPGDIKTKWSVIPHIAIDKTDYQAVLKDGFSMCYAGSVLPPREVSVFFEGIKQFKKTLNDADSFHVRFLVDKPQLVANSAESVGIEDLIKIEATVPYSRMPEFLAQSDVLVIIEAPLDEGIFMPSKIVDYAQIGRPILALSPAVGTISDILSRYGGGLAVDCQSVEAVTNALQTLYNHWKSGALNQSYNSDALMAYFSEDRVLGLYLELIEKLKTI